MQHQRFASGLASKGRSLLLWTTPLAFTAAVGMAVGGCPGPDPQTIGSGGNGGRGASSVEASSTSSQGGSSSSASVTTGSGKADGGCGPDRQVCDGMCADTTNGDILNCGKCGNTCATNNVDQAQCVNSSCVLQCADGFANVDPTLNPNCDTPARRVFVSSMTVDSKFGSGTGGIHAANTFCNQLAPAGGATFAAWVSVSDQTAATTVIGSFMGAYVLMDMKHTVVATSTELLAGTMLRHAIDTTESGTPLASNTPTPVWTGTTGNGLPTGFDCGGWLSTSATATATIGSWSAVDASWSNVGQPTACLANNHHVYCFEQ